jgi:tetratricopeptide (TPR) repeat protein
MDARIKRMLRKVKAGKVVLFLGAGASCAAGGLKGEELAVCIQREFLEEPLETNDLIGTCTTVLDKPGVDRTDVEDFIRKKLDLQPTDAHIALAHNHWQAILTTNYDDLVESAYRNTPDRVQRCEPVFSFDDFSRRQSDYVNILRLFKLMGCVNGRSEDSRMVLTRSDYNKKLRRRGRLFRLVYDYVKDGTILYIGYRFQDLIAFDILDEVVEEVGPHRLPWGWALLPEWDEELRLKLEQRKVLPLQMTFEELMAEIAKSPAVPPVSLQVAERTLTLGQTAVEIPPIDVRMYLRQFEFLHDGIGIAETPENVASRKDYLEGTIDPWIGIVRGWAFRRSLCSPLRETLLRNIDESTEKLVRVVSLTGPAGSGKSIAVRMVLFEMYKEHGYPVIFLRSDEEHLDYKVVDSFIRQLETEVLAQSGQVGKLPLLVVLDEAPIHMQDIRRLPQYLASRGIRCLLLLVSRENEWQVAQRDRKVKVDSEITVPDKFDAQDEDEVKRLVDHLRRLEVLISAHEDEYWLRQAKQRYDNSFSTTLYHLAEPTRPPITQAIKSEFDRLVPLAKDAYRHVCAFYQFGIPLDLELLARSLGCSYEDFQGSVYDPASKGVIVEDVSITGEIRFRARSRKVAELVVEHVFSEEKACLEDIRDVVAVSLPHNANEVQTIRNMLIHRIGPNGADPKQIDLVKAIFEAAFAAGMRDTAILHHFALLLLEQEFFSDAEEYAQKALEVLDDPHGRRHFRTESRQNLHNTLGMICARHGLHLERVGNEIEASERFSEAVKYFRSARTGEFANAYPFYSEAWMHLQRAKNTGGVQRLHHLAEAFQVLDESEGNLSDDEVPTIREMQAKVVAFMLGIPTLSDALTELESQGDPSATYLLARQAAAEADSAYGVEAAYAILSRALEEVPEHVGCLRLASRFFHQAFPEDFTNWKGLLDRRYALEDRRGQCGLLFDLGYASSQLADYHQAQRYFEELEAESTGHPRRSGIVAVVRDRGEDRRFQGIVMNVKSRYEGWVKNELLAREVKFIPIAQKFTVEAGQAVAFSLAMNYRGYLAINLRPG